ncbi:MAG: S8 family serine peptidase [Planctomycetes bacterium]|nr:S8 family serine peptidase [Planctomycetota bacterium]MCB9917653.1 S8 family serine peptidase [Planctomycetota bacterium]
MQPSNPAITRVLAVFLLAGLAGTAVSQQEAEQHLSEPRRVAPGSTATRLEILPKPPFPTAPQQATLHGIAEGPFYTPPMDDELDFAPYRDTGVADGEQQRRVLDGNPYRLAFAGGEFEPPPGVDPRVRTLTGSHFFGYVMLRGRMTAPDKLRAIDGLGVVRLRAHTWQTWVCKIPMDAVDRLSGLPFVHWVGLSKSSQKVHPLLQDCLSTSERGTTFRIDVDVFVSDRNDKSEVATTGNRIIGETQDSMPIATLIPNGPKQRALEDSGLTFEHYTDTGNSFLFRGTATAESIAKIRELQFVSSIELALEYRGDGDQSQAMIGQDKVRASWGGGPITVGVIDSGLWSPTAAQRHQDFKDKFLVGWDVVGTGAFNDEQGHGTGVTGVMIGSGTADARYRGGAPEIGRAASRRVFVGRLLDKNNKAVGNVQTLYDALAKPFADSNRVVSPRPRVVNNSWGSSPPAGTPWIGTESGARRVDDIVYNTTQVYVFASGNSGPSQAAAVPAVAKNSICVGSCRDNWSSTARPGDLVSSSAGGTADNRRKPEVLAPGLSACSTVRNSLTNYGNFSGTSFAAPHVTGVVASLIDHHTFLDYQPAQVKALMCAAAEWQGGAGTTTGWFGAQLGHGLVDASKMHGDSETGWFSGTAATELTRTGQWVYWDVTVPTSADHASLFLCWDEPAASSNAAQARVNDLRAYVDVEPFTAGGNTGEYSVSSSTSNVISKVGPAWAVALRGKKIRIKAYAQSIASRARIGMAMMWTTQSPSVGPKLLVGVTKPVMKPGDTFQMGGSLQANTGGHHFDNGMIRPLLPAGFTVIELRRVGLDNVVQTYNGTSHPSSPFPSLIDGMTVGQGMRRDLLWTIQAPSSSGSFAVGATAWADPGNATLNDSFTVCIDGLAPNNVSGLTSSSHFTNRWYDKTSLNMVWNQAQDSGCSGTRGYAYAIDHAAVAPTSVNIIGASITTKAFNLVSSTAGWYFNIKAADFAGNLSAKTTTMGPFYIDTTKPVISAFSIDNGAERTNTLKVTLRSTASDSFSGVHEMRFSSNGGTWSPWVAYSAAPVTYDLSSYGGNTQNGPKQVQIEVRDQAGNSIKSLDTIVYDSVPPVVSSVSINGGSTATNSLDVSVTVKGAGLPADMRFSSNDATWSPWIAYSEAAQSYDLSSFGGGTATGTKYVYCQMRDSVGNVSASKFDTISYYPIPSIKTFSPAQIPTVHDTMLSLTGSFADITRVVVNGVPLANNDPHEWYAGYFVKRSDTSIFVSMPQDVTTDGQILRIGNPAFLSAAVMIPRVHPTTPIFQCVPAKVAGKPIDLVMHRGSYPSSGLAILSLSASSTRLTIPNLIQLDHGGNPTTIVDPSFLTLPASGFDTTKRTAHWVLPTATSLKGVKLFFQPVLIDVKNPFKVPMDTANMDFVQLD